MFCTESTSQLRFKCSVATCGPGSLDWALKSSPLTFQWEAQSQLSLLRWGHEYVLVFSISISRSHRHLKLQMPNAQFPILPHRPALSLAFLLLNDSSNPPKFRAKPAKSLLTPFPTPTPSANSIHSIFHTHPESDHTSLPLLLPPGPSHQHLSAGYIQSTPPWSPRVCPCSCSTNLGATQIPEQSS